MPIAVHAPAKINLGLAVGSRRPDGYHDLQTILVRINLSDEITLTRKPKGISLMLQPPTPSLRRFTVPTGKTNIAVEAAALFLKQTGIPGGVQIQLLKRIPVGAGLGGGSSDAAAVLKGMNRLFGRPLTPASLSALALELGSDVPFFLARSSSIASGRGEELKPVSLPKLWLVLYIPSFPVSTAWAYSALDRSRRTGQLTGVVFSPMIAVARLQADGLAAFGATLHNSFESVVFTRHPELRQVKCRLLASGAVAALLSGSGSTLFALLPADAGRRAAVLRRLRRSGVALYRVETIA
jgi:4-diphosphocytidyl-2-C-methyl-D-erythritol kinase